MLELKNIYRGREVKFYDFFMEHKQALIDDFLKQNPTYKDVNATLPFASVPYQDGAINIEDAWKHVPIKESLTSIVVEENRPKYPTGFKLLEHFGDACSGLAYLSMEPGMILRRHTCPENKEAKRIRIHIPLIIPEGDIGFEVHAEEIRWDDIFAFNNQKAHSAWNLTSQRRLIFLIDMNRDACDMPPAPVWFPGCNDDAPRFEKTETESEVWQNSIKQQQRKKDIK